ncbi:MAG TPA: phosphotransferase [Roseiflexaceae bacterium]|nr:phosphotransferase [Roseiflexaceae bacterium]
MSDIPTPVAAALDAWRLPGPPQIDPLGGGINSHTWRVQSAGELFVAKLAADNPTFEAGLLVAEYLDQAGFQAGGPIRTRAGALSVPVGDQRLALLRFVHGQEIDSTQLEDLRTWGATMGRFHRLLRHMPELPAGMPRWPWDWFDPTAEHLGVESWIRPAVEQSLAALHQLERTQPLTLGIVHGDGAYPLVDRGTGGVAVIDWGAAMWGPLLYDLGSAYWYFQFGQAEPAKAFAPFLEAYRRHCYLPAEELAAIDVFARMRCAVQAFYFSWRIANDIRTGLADAAAENQEGLDDARRTWEQMAPGA